MALYELVISLFALFGVYCFIALVVIAFWRG